MPQVTAAMKTVLGSSSMTPTSFFVGRGGAPGSTTPDGADRLRACRALWLRGLRALASPGPNGDPPRPRAGVSRMSGAEGADGHVPAPVRLLPRGGGGSGRRRHG